METIRLSFNAIFPLLAYMTVGYLLKLRKFFSAKTVKEMNNLVFKLLLPLSIVHSIYTCDLKSSFRWDVAIFASAASVLLFVLLAAAVPRFEKRNDVIPVMVQGMHKANYNLLAISIVSSFVGNEIGMTAVLVAILTPIANICSVFSFEHYCSGEKSKPAAMLKKVLLNPMVFSSLLGVALNMLRVPIPTLVLDGVIKKLANMATPIALIALGADFDFSGLNHFGKQLAIVTIGKLILSPALILTAAVLCGIRGANLLAMAVFSGAPAAVNTYSTAVSMGGNEEFAGQIVVLTSICAMLTMFLWFCGIGWLGLI